MVWLNPRAAAGSVGFGLGDALLSLRGGLAAFVDAARRQQFVDLPRFFFNQLTLRQFIAGQRIPGDRPEVAVLLAERRIRAARCRRRVAPESLVSLSGCGWMRAA